ncbi:putative holo-[acyl-carrier-protein] synthase [Helianthus annuus]|nr:putative holo-[acyl-carrier-protein] synthase [Helianthus annuus]
MIAKPTKNISKKTRIIFGCIYCDTEMEMEKCVQRWLVNASEWDPSPNEFWIAMSVLPQHEHSSITRFVKIEDRKRALVSRLLQYALVHQVVGLPFDEIVINRTPEGKPYLAALC